MHPHGHTDTYTHIYIYRHPFSKPLQFETIFKIYVPFFPHQKGDA